MIEDRVIVAFKQGCKDEKTAEKLATKNPKMVAELYKINVGGLYRSNPTAN